MPENSWYETLEGPGLQQGDILRSCPVPTIGAAAYPLPEGVPVPVTVVELDLIVLTQSCDLEQSKVEEVLFAEVVDWATVKASGGDHVKKTDFRRALVQGSVNGYSLLSKSQEEVAMPWALVDFHRLHVLPRPFVDAFTGDCGPRLRMRSPYREHLAQAFARYFMRVGLPHDAKDFIEEGK